MKTFLKFEYNKRTTFIISWVARDAFVVKIRIVLEPYINSTGTESA